VAAPPALQKLAADYPALQIYAAMIDEGLNDQGFIVPGLGDVGDRVFGT
jgi:uracil phosphoribosyltransferase